MWKNEFPLKLSLVKDHTAYLSCHPHLSSKICAGWIMVKYQVGTILIFQTTIHHVSLASQYSFKPAPKPALKNHEKPQIPIVLTHKIIRS